MWSQLKTIFLLLFIQQYNGYTIAKFDIIPPGTAYIRALEQGPESNVIIMAMG